MTRLEAGALRLHREPVDLHDLVSTVLGQMTDRLHNHPLQTAIPPEFPLVSMDAVLIGQVLANLLDNASKYSPPGTPIVITARLAAPMDGREKPAIAVSIRDEGHGIPAGDLERVFDKFFRSSAAQGEAHRTAQVVGTGLGLSICKGIVEAHNGRIWITNNPDQGVTVTFTLPD